MNKAAHIGFETQRRRHQKSKIRGISASTKRTCVQNRGISGPTKMSCVQQNLETKKFQSLHVLNLMFSLFLFVGKYNVTVLNGSNEQNSDTVNLLVNGHS